MLCNGFDYDVGRWESPLTSPDVKSDSTSRCRQVDLSRLKSDLDLENKKYKLKKEILSDSVRYALWDLRDLAWVE